MPRFVFSASEEWEYVLKEDRNEDGTPKDGAPRFILGNLSRIVRKHIENSTLSFKQSSTNGSDRADTVVNMGDRHELSVKYGLKRIEGIEADWFKVQFMPKFNCEGVTEQTLDILRNHIAELGAEIWDKSVLTKAQEKNSATPST